MRVFHKVTFGSDIPMGKVEIPFESLGLHDNPTCEDWFPLQLDGRMRIVCGDLFLSFRLVTTTTTALSSTGARINEPVVNIELPPEEPPSCESELPNELHITIIRGRSIMIRDKYMFRGGGSSDPYVKIKLHNFSTKRTKVIHKNLNPIWYIY